MPSQRLTALATAYTISRRKGGAPSLPASFKTVKAITLGDATLSPDDIQTIAGKLQNNGVVDLGEARFATTEFPEVFKRNTSLEGIVLPYNIKTLASSGSYSSAFYNCSNLKKIALPEGLTALTENAFYGCSKLEQAPYSVDRCTDRSQCFL